MTMIFWQWFIGLMPMIWFFFFQVITVDDICFLYILHHRAKLGYCPALIVAVGHK